MTRNTFRDPVGRAAAEVAVHPHSNDFVTHYVAERRDMIRYPEFSPPEERLANRQSRRAGKAMCKTTTARLKRCGMRWDADNADLGAPGLAGLEQSDPWKLYWQTRLKPTG